MIEAAEKKQQQQRGLQSDPAIRARNTEHNRCCVMHLLRGEKYASIENLAVALGMTVQGTRKIMNRMLREQLVVKFEVPERSRTTVWGASSYGFHRYYPPGLSEPLSDKAYEYKFSRHLTRSRIKPSKYEHTLQTQSVRVVLEKAAGLGSWTAERDLPHFAPTRENRLHKWGKYPDGILSIPGHLTLAIELERSNKSTRQYGPICRKHEQNIALGRYDHVLYVCRTERQRNALKHKMAGQSFITSCLLGDDYIEAIEEILDKRWHAERVAQEAAAEAAAAAKWRKKYEREQLALLAKKREREAQQREADRVQAERDATLTGCVAKWWKSLEA